MRISDCGIFLTTDYTDATDENQITSEGGTFECGVRNGGDQ